MEKILIIEDSKSAAAILALGIQRHTRLDFELAQTLGQAKKILDARAEEFFLALCDLNLPDSPSGASVDLALEYKLAAVVVTGMCDEETRQAMLSRDIADYIVKQDMADFQYLFRLINRIYNNRHVSAMVVDDSKTYREHMRGVLLRQKIKTYAVARGAEALDILIADPAIKLVLTDYLMPDMDGLELIREIRKTHGMDDLAVIGTSAADAGKLSHTFLKSGANDFMSKTAPVEELVCRINMNLDMMELLNNAKKQKTSDPVTGLCNKNQLFLEGEETLERWRRADHRPPLAVIQVDRFDALIRDRGWLAGDAALCSLADVLRQSAPSPSILARLGGGTFCALCLSPRPQDIDQAFHDVSSRAAEARVLARAGDEASAFGYTVSIGVDMGLGAEKSFEARLAKTQDMLELASAQGPRGFRVN